jgi:hypothetical protein
MQINKKTFTLINRISQSFDIAINNFAFAVTFLFRIKPKIIIDYIASFISYATVVLYIKSIKSSYIASYIYNQVQIINNKTIKAVYAISEIMNAASTINIKNTIVFISNAIQYATTIIDNKKISIIANPTIAVFFTLGDHDSSALSVLDPKTLGALDYS